MNDFTRRMALCGLILILPLLTGCGAGTGERATENLGQLSLPLAAQGPSGLSYRLRDAIFDIYSAPYYYYYGAAGAFGGFPGSASATIGAPSAGFGGTGGGGNSGVITLNGEDDPNANSLSVPLETGSYFVSLRPGWRFEKVENGIATPVDAQLLTASSLWVYVSPHSTTWASFQFGIGDRALWFNGELDINLNVYEDPSQYYGGGFGGFGAVGGASSVAGSSGAGSPPAAAGSFGG